MLDPNTLEIIEGSQFSSDVKPENINSPDYLTDERVKTIEWHAKMRGVTKEDIINKWANSPNLDVTWQLFTEHVDKYNKSKTQYDAPIAAGINIINFDLIISNRLNERFKVKRMFNHEIIDLRHIAYYLLIWDSTLKSRSMDSLRTYFGLEKSAAHTAEVDVKEEALIISRCLKYFKAGFRKDKFRNSMKAAK